MALDRLLQGLAKQKPETLDLQAEQTEIKKMAEQDHSLSLHSFDITTYQRLLPLTKMASKEEQSTLSAEEQLNNARRHAIKLSILFVTADEVIAYLKRFAKRYPENNQLLHDACLFSLPEGDGWNVVLWRSLVAKHHPSYPEDLIMRLFPFAGKIEKYVREHKEQLTEEIRTQVTQEKQRDTLEKNDGSIALSTANQDKQKYVAEQHKKARTINAIVESKAASLLSSKTPLAMLQRYASAACYQRGQESPGAAQLFFSYGMTETNFNQYLALVPQDDPKYIPDVLLMGKDIAPTYERHYLKKLNPADPRAALLGKLTSCCQSLGQLFDSVESQMDFRNHHEMLIADFYIELAHHLVNQCEVNRVLVGTGGHTPNNLGVFETASPSLPVQYGGYRDSDAQRLVADKGLPLLQAYTSPKAALSLSLRIENLKLSPAAMKEWRDFCSTKDANGDTIESSILRYAARAEKWDVVQWLVEQGAEVNAKDSDGDTVLHVAAWAKKWDVVRCLVKHGADVKAVDSDDETALYYAAQAGKLEVVQCLVKQGAEVNAKNRCGVTALPAAARAKKWDVVKCLVGYGIDVNSESKHGRMTALHYAAHAEKWDVVKWLAEHGGDVNRKTSSGQTVLDIALEVSTRVYSIPAPATLIKLLKTMQAQPKHEQIVSLSQSSSFFANTSANTGTMHFLPSQDGKEVFETAASWPPQGERLETLS